MTSLLKNIIRDRHPRYGYFKNKRGVDNLWTIFEAATGHEVASVVFWSDDTGWRARAEAQAQLIVKALNDYRGRRAERRAFLNPRFVVIDNTLERGLEIVDSADSSTFHAIDLDYEAAYEKSEIEAGFHLIARALNAFTAKP